MSYLEVFRVLTEVGVHLSNVVYQESQSEKQEWSHGLKNATLLISECKPGTNLRVL